MSDTYWGYEHDYAHRTLPNSWSKNNGFHFCTKSPEGIKSQSDFFNKDSCNTFGVPREPLGGRTARMLRAGDDPTYERPKSQRFPCPTYGLVQRTDFWSSLRDPRVISTPGYGRSFQTDVCQYDAQVSWKDIDKENVERQEQKQGGFTRMLLERQQKGMVKEGCRPESQGLPNPKTFTISQLNTSLNKDYCKYTHFSSKGPNRGGINSTSRRCNSAGPGGRGGNNNSNSNSNSNNNGVPTNCEGVIGKKFLTKSPSGKKIEVTERQLQMILGKQGLQSMKGTALGSLGLPQQQGGMSGMKRSNSGGGGMRPQTR